MRNWIALIESLDRHPIKDELDFFTSEGCAAFAYALWLAHDKVGKLRLLSNPRGEKWSDDLPEFTHVVYVDLDGSHFDVRGLQMPDEIAARFGLTNNDWGDSFEPSYFWQTFVGNDDRHPLYGDDHDIKWALKIISEYRDIYQ